MTEELTTTPEGLRLCYEVLGEGDPLLLVMGLGGPMTWWSDNLCRELVDRGFRVVRYDNRDTGRSSRVEGSVRLRDLARAYLGRGGTAPYSLSDLARDAVSVLDAADMPTAHIAGVSMGGMIAQTLTLEHPERVRSLTSIMSTTGNRRVGRVHPRLLPGMLAPQKPGREGYLAGATAGSARIGSPAYPEPHADALARAEVTWERGWDRDGVQRHMMAVLTQPDRTEALGRLDLPVTVVHGLADPLVRVSGGRATARAIRGSDLVLIPGMGHDLPVELHGDVADVIRRTADRAS